MALAEETSAGVTHFITDAAFMHGLRSAGIAALLLRRAATELHYSVNAIVEGLSHALQLCWQPISGRTLKVQYQCEGFSMLTMSNDLVTSLNAKENDICCSLRFFGNCQMEKTMPTFEPSARKPNAL